MEDATDTAAIAAHKLVLSFDEADGLDTSLLGGKGFGLAQMTAVGLPVPPGFIITTTVCQQCSEGRLPEAVWLSIVDAVRDLEMRSGRSFSGRGLPLLVSVRSGAPVSMPGMMDTVLNLGLNSDSLLSLAESTGDTAFAADTFIRFARMFSEIVFGADGEVLDELGGFVERLRTGPPEGGLRALVSEVSEVIERVVGRPLPLDPWEQLGLAINAVFESWNSRRAVRYRDFYSIPGEIGTAVVVQQMVFGNLGEVCGTGVAFTRDPRTGEASLYGEYIERGQGEDIVAGTHTPQPLTEVAERHPRLTDEFEVVARQLERLYKDIVDIEFTVEDGKLYLLQVRVGKRTAEAAVRAAVDLADEGIIDRATAVARVTPDQLRQIRRPRFNPRALEDARANGLLLATGNGASPGQVSGILVTDSDRAEKLAATGDAVILVRTTTSPQDLHGMLASAGIVTGRGGSTSHAAVVARSLDKPCIVGCEAITVDADARTMTVDGRVHAEGAIVSIDGATGELFDGSLPLVISNYATRDSQARLLSWADECSRCELYTRVATPAMALSAIEDGANGIGVRLEEVLVASEGLSPLLEALEVVGRGAVNPDLGGLEEAISTSLLELLGTLESRPFVARAIDVSWGRAGEMINELANRLLPPGMWLPLGSPNLLRAQVRGVYSAVLATQHEGSVTLMVGGISEVAEVERLRRLCEDETNGRLRVGVAVRSPRGLLALEQIMRAADVVWLDYRALTAAVYHYPDELILSDGALEAYIADGFLGTDPRHEVDEVLRRIIDSTDGLPVSDSEIGVNFVGWEVHQDVLDFFESAGYRRFAVDRDEAKPARLLLGRQGAKGA